MKYSILGRAGINRATQWTLHVLLHWRHMTTHTCIWVNNGRDNSLLKTAPCHYLNQCWLTIKVFSGILWGAIQQVVVRNLIRTMCSKTTCLKLLTFIPGANELYESQLWLPWGQPLTFVLCHNFRCGQPPQMRTNMRAASYAFTLIIFRLPYLWSPRDVTLL